MGLNFNAHGIPSPSAALDKTAAQATSPDPHKASGEAGHRKDSSGVIEPLLKAQSQPVRVGDFDHAASVTRREAVKTDRRHLSPAGAASAGSLQVPLAKVEEFARDALQSTLQLIDVIAGTYLGLREKLLASGTERELAQLEGDIQRLLARGEKTMVDLAADIVRRELAAPPSAALQKLLGFFTTRLWSGIRNMQAELRGSIGEPASSTPSPAATEPRRHLQMCRNAGDRQHEIFQAEMADTGFGRAPHVTFNPGRLVRIAAALTLMQETRLQGRPAAPDPSAGKGADIPPPRNSGRTR